MRFSDIIANKSLCATLASLVDEKRVPHAILLYDNDGGEAFAVAMAFLSYLFCSSKTEGDSCSCCAECNKVSKMIHPDIHFVFPTNIGRLSGNTKSADVTSEMYMKEFRELALSNPYFTADELCRAIGVEGKSVDINVKEAESILSQLSLTAVEGGYKAVVVYQPDKFNVQAANKLLKLIEEPPSDTVFLMITHSPEKILQTIFSRLQCFRVLPLSAEQQKTLRGESKGENDELFRGILYRMLDAVTRGSLLGALDAASELAGLSDREIQKSFCIFASQTLRKIFFLQQGMKTLAFLDEDETESLERYAGRLKKNWPRSVAASLDRAYYFLERNVNAKILFSELACRMFV